jgi:hypothetical protein
MKPDPAIASLFHAERPWRGAAYVRRPGDNMRNLILFASLALLATSGCSAGLPKTPPGWVKVANERFAFFVPPTMTMRGIPGTNALHGEFESKSIRLAFSYELSTEDYSGWTKARHYACYEERIAGKRAQIVSFYYEPATPYHEFIAVRFPDTDGKDYELGLTALCNTTNDYETVRKSSERSASNET